MARKRREDVRNPIIFVETSNTGSCSLVYQYTRIANMTSSNYLRTPRRVNLDMENIKDF